MTATPRRVRLGLLLVCTAVGLLEFGHFVLDDLARGAHGTAVRRLLEELTGSLSAFALLPVNRRPDRPARADADALGKR